MSHIPAIKEPFLILWADLPSCPHGTVFTKSMCGTLWSNSPDDPNTKQYVFNHKEMNDNIANMHFAPNSTNADILLQLEGSYFVDNLLYSIISPYKKLVVY